MASKKGKDGRTRRALDGRPAADAGPISSPWTGAGAFTLAVLVAAWMLMRTLFTQPAIRTNTRPRGTTAGGLRRRPGRRSVGWHVTRRRPVPAARPRTAGSRSFAVTVGAKNGEAVQVDLGASCGMALTDLGAESVARAVCDKLLKDYNARLVAPCEVVTRLLGADDEAANLHGLTVTETLGHALTQIEVELFGRNRLREDAKLPGRAAVGPRCNEALSPVVLFAVADPANLRLRTVLEEGVSEGIYAILLGDWPYGALCKSNADGTVTAATGSTVEHLIGARLDTLTAEELRARLPQPVSAEDEVSTRAATPEAEPSTVDESTGAANSEEMTSRPRVWIRAFGRRVIEIDGREHPLRMNRNHAWRLLDLLVVHRSGMTDDAICEELWPGEEARAVAHRLHTVVSTLNNALREATGAAAEAKFVLNSRECRLLNPALIGSDLWEFEDLVGQAAVSYDGSTIEALRLAVELASVGPLLRDDPHLWVLSYQQQARRRAIDAVMRLSEIEQAENPELALEHLRRVIDNLDPIAEALYCQTMRIQADLGRKDAIQRTWDLLCSRLTDDEMEPSEETRRLYLALVGSRS